MAGDANSFFLPSKKASLSLARISFLSSPSSPILVCISTIPEPWFLHQLPRRELLAKRIEITLRSSMEEEKSRNSILLLSTTLYYSIYLFWIIRTASDRYRLKRITIVGIKSEKKEEINKRKRKKTNAIRILPFYRNAWCVRASLFKRDVVAVFQTLRFRLNGAK